MCKAHCGFFLVRFLNIHRLHVRHVFKRDLVMSDNEPEAFTLDTINFL